MYFCRHDRNEMASMVYNWDSDDVDAVVVTPLPLKPLEMIGAIRVNIETPRHSQQRRGGED